MPLSQEDAAWLAKQGYTPEQIAQADYAEQQPTTNGAPTIPQTIGRVAKAHAGGYIGGGAGAIGGAALGAELGALGGPAAPVTVPVGAVAGGIIGAVGGGMAGQKIQQAVTPEETYAQQQAAAEEAAQANPKTALGTDIVASALASGGKPSLNALRSVRGLIGAARGAGMTDVEKQALFSTALNAGINPAINTGISYATTGQMPSGADIGAQVLGGAVFSGQAGWAKRLTTHEPNAEVNDKGTTDEQQTSTATAPDFVSPFTARDETTGQYKLSNATVKRIFLGRMATKVPQDADDITKGYIQSRNEQLRSMPIDDMRNALHQQEAEKSVVEPSMETSDYVGGEMPELKGLNYDNIPSTTPKSVEQPKTITPQSETPTVFKPEILQEIIDKGATKPVAVQRIFPKLNLSDEQANEALRQAKLLAELHENHPNETEETQNATGIRENTGLPNEGGKVGEGREANRSNDLVEKTPGSEAQPIPPRVSSGLSDEEKLVQSPLSDYNRYQELVKQLQQSKDLNTTQALQKELESIKNKYGGKPPPKFPENNVLMPVVLQHHIISGRATTGSVLYGLANTPDHPLQPLANALLNAADAKSLNTKWFHDNTLDKEGGPRSHYSMANDEVRIGTGSAGDARVVMEEAVHSLTSKKIPYFKGQGEEHYNRLNAYLKTGKNEAVKDLIRSYFEVAKHLRIDKYLFKDTPIPGPELETLNFLKARRLILPNIKEVESPVKGLRRFQWNDADSHEDLYAKDAQDAAIKILKSQGSNYEGIEKGLAGSPDTVVKRLNVLGHTTKYAMGNLDEFIAQALKDPEFQRVLDGIKTSDNRSVWQKIVDAVRNLLGLSAKEGSMLDRVLRSSGELVAQERPTDVERRLDIAQAPPKTGEKVEPIQPKFAGRLGKFFTNAILRAREVSPDVADAYHRFFNARQQIYGDVYGKVKNVMERTGFTRQDGDRLLQAMRMEELNKKPVPMSFFKNQAQRQVWNEYKKVYREQGEEAVKDKQPVYDYHTGQLRLRKLSDVSHPLMLNPKISETIRANTDQPEIERLHQEFLADQAKRGIKPDVAERNYQTAVAGIRGNISSSGSVGNLNWFNANRRAQGVPLPDSWTRQDFEQNLRAYASRNAADRAHFKYVESNPDVMAQLGETKDAWGNDIPKSNKPVVAGNSHIKILTQEAHGEVGPQGFYTERAGSGAATALFIASPALSAVHVPISNVAGIVSLTDNPLQTSRMLWSGLKGMTSGIATARANGIMVPAARPASDMWDASLTSAEHLQAFSSIVRRIASLNDIVTKGNIGFMQAAMRYLVPSKLTRANQGDATAQQWLRKLDPDYAVGKEYTNEQLDKLASTAVGYIHGTNDPRTMPEWMMRDSEVSGFFSIAHWSVAQTDRFMRDVWTPFKNGNYTPLIMSIFGATIGGYIIKDLREQISGKRSPIPSITEIINSERGLSGNAGPLAYNAIAAMQYAGFGGMFSQLAKYPFDMAYKNNPQGAAFPLDEEVSDIAKTSYDVASAIMNDPNINWVDLAKLVTNHILTSDFRLAREGYYQMINNGIITGTLAERKQLSDKLGQLRRFEQVEGMPFDQAGGIDTNPYMFPEQQEFKREQDLGHAMQELPTLINNIMTQYGDNPDIAMAKLKSLRSNQYATFPDIEAMPLKFMKYLGFLQRTEGPEAANEELQSYMKHKMINQAKSSVVP